jgi:Big-like domain-containing protein
MMRAALSIGLLLFAAACGNPAVIAPEPLTIVDTTPGNGAVVPPGDTAIGVLFSADMDPATLANALVLEAVSDGGTPIESVMTRLDHYAKDTFTAIYGVDPLKANQAFRLTMKRDALRAVSGATLRTDFIRSFRTAN